jgi:hypothetical protein
MGAKQAVAVPIRSREQELARFSAKVVVSEIVTLLLHLWLVLIIYLPAIRAGHADFRNMYTAGYMVRTGLGSEIYDDGATKILQDALVSKESLALPYIRPAYQALVYVPLSMLPFQQAYYTFLAFNLAILFLCMRLLHPYTSNLAHLRFDLPAIMFLFFPITVALMQGQDSIILLALLIGAFLCMRRNHECLAGGLVALGLFKFQLVIPIFALFLMWRRWRFSAAFACTSAVLTGISIWILGVAQSVRYFHELMGVILTLSFSAGMSLKMNLMANLHGAFYALLNGSPLALQLTVAASAAVMILLALRRPKGADALLVAIPSSALVSYYLHPHDMCILILPIVVILDRMIGITKNKYRFRRIQIITATLLLVTPTLLIFAYNQFWLASLPLLAFAFAITAYPSTAAA